MTDLLGKPQTPSRNFRFYWIGTSVSFLGSNVTSTVIPLIAALTLQASPLELGLLVAAEVVPNLLAPLFAGPLVDRQKKRTILISADLTRAVLIAAIPTLYFFDALSMSALILIGFAAGAFTVIGDTGSFSYVPELVPQDSLGKANSRLETSRSVAGVAGPGLGGSLAHAFSAPVALIVDACSYVFSALCLLRVKHSEATSQESESGDPYFKLVSDGLKYVFRTPAIRLLALGPASYNFFAGAVDATAVIYIVRELEISSSAYGFAMAFGAAGGVIGAWMSERVRRLVGDRWALIGGIVVGSTQPVLFALAGGHSILSLAVVTAGFFVNSAGITTYLVVGITVRQTLIPREMIGRAFSSMRALSRGALPLGAVLGGLLASSMSLQTVLLLAGAGEFLVGVAYFKYRHYLPEHIS
ncbi:MFS transporter [Streptomyces sp. NPDC058255]|uniref:MFS transporter n=1 Tax=Streptomyces sp. NPDC058255 TaxID=3346407 RepID=UPI0036E4399D